MEFKMKKATKVLVAGACAAALMVGSAVPAMAVDIPTTVDVTYSTSQTVGGNANWAVEMPTAVTFDGNIGTPSTFAITLINSDGGGIEEITTLSKGLPVSMISANSMELVGEGAAAGAAPLPYKIEYSATDTTVVSEPLFDETTPATGETVFATLKATAAGKAVTGEATRKASPLTGGTFKDTLTFIFDKDLTN